jgi:ferredoxin
MATVITQECINCGACESECPNTAIYQGGVEYEHRGAKQPALKADIFYIVPEKCTECVGFFAYEACAAVCPVDCCVPDPERPEAEAVLLDRARELHPDKTFGEDFPSRFRESAVAPESAGSPASAAPTVAAAPAVPQVAATQSVDPARFEVPILCRSCEGEYLVEFRFLTPGMILRCPHCGVSFNPSTRLYMGIAARIDRLAEQLNAEIDRHNDQVVAEQELFEANRDDIREAAEREIRRLVEAATEAPKRSMFG